jgi:hypothetical protein
MVTAVEPLSRVALFVLIISLRTFEEAFAGKEEERIWSFNEHEDIST